MAKDLHHKPFDEETLTKLKLYRQYLREWLPVFLKKENPYFTKINIFDFFCGPGQDENQVPGSPIISTEELSPYISLLKAKQKLEVNVYLNEFSLSKHKYLKSLYEERKVCKGPVNYHFFQLDFSEAFSKLLPVMQRRSTANLVFLDQNGVKHLTNDVFLKLTSLRGTDFLFFVSSSFFVRFKDHPLFRQYFPDLEEQLRNKRYYNIHRDVLKMYKGWLGKSDWYMGQFTIKRNANIYGLIFGSRNTLGIEKFLRTCWKEDNDRGEANFDIDEDHLDSNNPTLFRELNVAGKLQIFETDLEKYVLDGKLKTNHSLYKFALIRGCLPDHARHAVKLMLEKKLIPNQKINISQGAFKKEETLIQLH